MLKHPLRSLVEVVNIATYTSSFSGVLTSLNRLIYAKNNLSQQNLERISKFVNKFNFQVFNICILYIYIYIYIYICIYII